MTHPDPFAPTDSPQHPANWGRGPQPEQPEQPGEFEHLRNRAAPVTTADDLAEYAALFAEHATQDEAAGHRDGVDAEEYPTLAELRERAEDAQRAAAEADREGEQRADREPAEVLREHLANYYREDGDGDEVPPLATLRARASLARPAASAPKAKWLEYVLTIAPDLTPDEAEARTVAELKGVTL